MNLKRRFSVCGGAPEGMAFRHWSGQFAGLLLSLGLATLSGGCSQDESLSRLNAAIPDRKEVVPVAGTISVDGEPQANLMVRLVPASDTAPAPTAPRTTTDEKGAFHFTTYLDGDGVPPGNYRVLVEWLNKMGSGGWSGPDKLKNLYNHLDSPAATVVVASGQPVSDLKIELKLAGRDPKQAPPYAPTRTGKPIKDRRGRIQ